jgi:hypothetical protein
MIREELVKGWEVNYDAVEISHDKYQEAVDDWSNYLEEQALKKDALAQAGICGEQYKEACRLIDNGMPFDATLSLAHS